jgi:non-ribosomal peptide synthetase component F
MRSRELGPSSRASSYNNLTLDAELRAIGGEWQDRRVQLIGQTNYPVALIVYGGMRLLLRLEYSRSRFDDGVARRLIGYVENLLVQIAASAKSRRLASLSLQPTAEKYELINRGRAGTSQPMSVPLHTQFEEIGIGIEIALRSCARGKHSPLRSSTSAPTV